MLETDPQATTADSADPQRHSRNREDEPGIETQNVHNREGSICTTCRASMMRCSCPRGPTNASTGDGSTSRPVQPAGITPAATLPNANAAVTRSSIETGQTERALQELIEQEILAHFEVVKSYQEASAPTTTMNNNSWKDGWSGIQKILEALAYHHFSPCPWTLLGLPKEEGPAPTIDMIERRTRLATLLASARHNASWEENERTCAHAFEAAAELARSRCVEELPAVLRARKRTRAAVAPRWLEPSPELAVFLHERARNAGANWRAALHLSNLQGSDFNQLPQLIPPLEGRNFYETFIRGMGAATMTLSSYSGAGLIMWAPQEKDSMQRLAAAYLEFATKTTQECELQLLIPHDAYPDCDNATTIRDLWWHPLFSDKWRSIVKAIEFLRQPARCVFSGNNGPLYHVKSLVLVTLATFAQDRPQSMISWRGTLVSEDHGPIIWVDTDAVIELATRRVLAGTNLAGLLRWEGPLRSFGSSQLSRRICFRGYFEARTVTALAVQLHIKTLKSQPGLGTALIGSQSLFTDPSTLLAEIPNVGAATEIASLADEIVLASPSLAILHTSCSQIRWEEALTELLQNTPEYAVEKLKWRQSRHGGRPFAKPVALDVRRERTRASLAARNAATDTGEAALTSIITVNGALGADPLALMKKIMEILRPSWASNWSTFYLRAHCKRTSGGSSKMALGNVLGQLR